MDYGAVLVSTVISAVGVTIGTILQSLVEAYFFKFRERRRNQRAVGGESGITTSTANPTVANRRHNADTKVTKHVFLNKNIILFNFVSKKHKKQLQGSKELSSQMFR